MPLYEIVRTYIVEADSQKDARISFSRALEDGTEDEYYQRTSVGYASSAKHAEQTGWIAGFQKQLGQLFFGVSHDAQ